MLSGEEEGEEEGRQKEGHQEEGNQEESCEKEKEVVVCDRSMSSSCRSQAPAWLRLSLLFGSSRYPALTCPLLGDRFSTTEEIPCENARGRHRIMADDPGSVPRARRPPSVPLQVARGHRPQAG